MTVYSRRPTCKHWLLVVGVENRTRTRTQRRVKSVQCSSSLETVSVVVLSRINFNKWCSNRKKLKRSRLTEGELDDSASMSHNRREIRSNSFGV